MCRTKEEYEVEELTGRCILTLADINPEDAGPFLVIFPGKVKRPANLFINITFKGG